MEKQPNEIENRPTQSLADGDELKTPFVREERYIVVKLKHLSPEQEDDLRAFLRMRRIATIESAVIESDWPEYEPVWAMIEARVTGASQ